MRTSSNNKDAGVNEEGDHERQCHVQSPPSDCRPLAPDRPRVVPSLDDGCSQVDVVRHAGGAKDTDGIEQLARTRQYL